MGSDLFAEGIAAPAEYHTPGVREYRDNPFIEALPPLLGRAEAMRAMAVYPEYGPENRLASPMERESMASLLMNLRHPVGLHGELHARLSCLMRNGYIARNPTRSYFQANIDARERSIRVAGKGDALEVSAYALGVGARPSSTGLTFLGITGIGKTVAMEMCLSLYPQLIVHTEYRGKPFTRTQIVWLRINAGKGSILGLCERFFTAVDALHQALDVPTRYLDEYLPPRTTIDKAVTRMARVAAQHGIGLLVIDEIQELQLPGSRAVLSFLVELVNTVGVPVVLVGGIDALPVLTQQFRQARRGASEGDLIVREAERGRDWRAFCEVLWRFQYTREVTELTDRHLAQLYEESQGITQYLVLAYKLAQKRAIATGKERMTPGIIKSIRDSLSAATPTLNALRKAKEHPGHLAVLRQMHDVALPENIKGIPFLRADPDAPDAGPDAGGAPEALADRTARPKRPEPSDPGPPPAARFVAPSGDRPARAPRKRPAALAPSAPALQTSDAPPAPDAGSPNAGSTARAPAGAGTIGAGTADPSLPDVVRSARGNGVGAHAALVRHGVIGDALWTALADPAGG